MLFLLGYMGVGKTTLGNYMNTHFNYSFIDLDDYIETQEKQSIALLFKNKGEIYFRKIEHTYLKKIIKENAYDIVALGGGTPCYYNNVELISQNPHHKSVYLKVDLDNLSERLFANKSKRPLLSHIKSKVELKDFIRKHLFEREFYYRKATHLINMTTHSVEEIATKLHNILE